MHAADVSSDSPLEQYERSLEVRGDRAWLRIRLCVVLWAVAQCFAVTDLLLGHVFLLRYDADALFTTALIWFVSVPCGLGAGAFTLIDWPRLRRRPWLLGLLPWIVTTAESTAVLWLLFK